MLYRLLLPSLLVYLTGCSGSEEDPTLDNELDPGRPPQSDDASHSSGSLGSGSSGASGGGPDASGGSSGASGGSSGASGGSDPGVAPEEPFDPEAAYTTENNFGLTQVGQGSGGGNMRWYRFQTPEISWNPAVNVLLPAGYETSGKRYPVLYLYHGGAQDFRTFDIDTNINVRQRAAGRELIIVMPDGGIAGWYSNPVEAKAGPRNWENFHIFQLIPWMDKHFRTFPEQNGRAVSGFSMGGFGALKYMAKYPNKFDSVSSHSGPASIRRDFGAVVHWANTSASVVDLGGGSIYGMPNWDQARVTADNPVENLERYRNKRIFLVTGLDNDPINENQVRHGQWEFRHLLHDRGIMFDAHELAGGHFVRPHMLERDIDGVVAKLRKAGP